MIKTVDIDGEIFHADFDGKPLLDEHGKMIEASFCICAARSPSECCCGAWDDVVDWNEDDDEW